MGVLAARIGPTGSASVTVTLVVHYHAPAYGPLTFEGRVLAGGRTVRTIEVVTRGADGRRCSTATGTMAPRTFSQLSTPGAS